jgi:F0F1-type ATP synthase assembly protein I
MATSTTSESREARKNKRLKPKPKTESKSWQTRNAARKEKQTAHAAKVAADTGH